MLFKYILKKIPPSAVALGPGSLATDEHFWGTISWRSVYPYPTRVLPVPHWPKELKLPVPHFVLPVPQSPKEFELPVPYVYYPYPTGQKELKLPVPHWPKIFLLQSLENKL